MIKYSLITVIIGLFFTSCSEDVPCLTNKYIKQVEHVEMIKTLNVNSISVNITNKNLCFYLQKDSVILLNLDLLRFCGVKNIVKEFLLSSEKNSKTKVYLAFNSELMNKRSDFVSDVYLNIQLAYKEIWQEQYAKYEKETYDENLVMSLVHQYPLSIEIITDLQTNQEKEDLLMKFIEEVGIATPDNAIIDYLDKNME